jgi:hypothetical protein
MKLQLAHIDNLHKTYIIIPNDTYHIYEHRISSINDLKNKVHTCQNNGVSKERDLNIMRETLHDNEYNINLGTRYLKQHKERQSSTCNRP